VLDEDEKRALTKRVGAVRLRVAQKIDAYITLKQQYSSFESSLRNLLEARSANIEETLRQLDTHLRESAKHFARKTDVVLEYPNSIAAMTASVDQLLERINQGDVGIPEATNVHLSAERFKRITAHIAALTNRNVDGLVREKVSQLNAWQQSLEKSEESLSSQCEQLEVRINNARSTLKKMEELVKEFEANLRELVIDTKQESEERLELMVEGAETLLDGAVSGVNEISSKLEELGERIEDTFTLFSDIRGVVADGMESASGGIDGTTSALEEMNQVMSEIA